MAKFVVYKDKAGWYRWRLIAGNGEKVSASEAYVSKTNTARSAKSVRQIASLAIIVDAEQEAIQKTLATLISKR